MSAWNSSAPISKAPRRFFVTHLELHSVSINKFNTKVVTHLSIVSMSRISKTYLNVAYLFFIWHNRTNYWTINVQVAKLQHCVWLQGSETIFMVGVVSVSPKTLYTDTYLSVCRLFMAIRKGRHFVSKGPARLRAATAIISQRFTDSSSDFLFLLSLLNLLSLYIIRDKNVSQSYCALVSDLNSPATHTRTHTHTS